MIYEVWNVYIHFFNGQRERRSWEWLFGNLAPGQIYLLQLLNLRSSCRHTTWAKTSFCSRPRRIGLGWGGPGANEGLKFWPRIEELRSLNDLCPVGIVLMVNQTWSHLRRPCCGVAEWVEQQTGLCRGKSVVYRYLAYWRLKINTIWMVPSSFEWNNHICWFDAGAWIVPYRTWRVFSG